MKTQDLSTVSVQIINTNSYYDTTCISNFNCDDDDDDDVVVVVVVVVTACRNTRLKKLFTKYMYIFPWCGIEHSVNIPLRNPTYQKGRLEWQPESKNILSTVAGDSYLTDRWAKPRENQPSDFATR